jgi:probable selenium-dependent hydroxylase accessory protein YqeC
MNLYEALNPKLPARIAIIGGGGKTTALFQLARQIPGKVWVSTTTHLGTDQLEYADKHYVVHSVDDCAIPQWLEQKSTLLTGDFTPDDRVKGPGKEIMDQIKRAADKYNVSLVIEADGSRSRPLKAPGENEPATPDWAEMVITVAGLSVLGQVFSESTVHRVEPFAQITGLQIGDIITIESIAQLFASPLGGLKNSPAKAVKAALFNQEDTSELIRQVVGIVPQLLAAGYDCVLVGALQKAPHELQCFRN